MTLQDHDPSPEAVVVSLITASSYRKWVWFLVGVVSETVEGALGQDRVVEERDPLDLDDEKDRGGARQRRSRTTRSW